MSDEQRRTRRRRFGLDQPGRLGERREGQEPVGRRRASVPAPARRRTERERAQPAPRPAGGDAPEPQTPFRLRWRLLALGCAVLEVALIVLLVASPVFRVREVQVEGATRVGAERVLAVAGVQTGGSIFLLDSRAITRRLDGQVWVRTSSVATALPGTVRISVQEWQPVAVYTPDGASAVYLSSQGTILGAANAHGGLTLIDGPDTGTAPGHLAINDNLLRPLVNIEHGLPGLIGQPVDHFQFDTCWNLTMYAGDGWRAIFGRMLTPSDYATLQSKVAALRSVAGQVNFKDPGVYVNLENPSEVTIGHGPDVEATPTPSPTPSPSASPKSAPTPTPKPSATPTPGPVSVVTPTPTATPSISPSPTPAAQGACS